MHRFVSRAVTLLGFSRSTVSGVYQEWSTTQRTSSQLDTIVGSCANSHTDPLTCDPEAVGPRGVRQHVAWCLVVLKQRVPLREVVVPKEIQSVCQRETG